LRRERERRRKLRCGVGQEGSEKAEGMGGWRGKGDGVEEASEDLVC
jgi:hypothetical protein